MKLVKKIWECACRDVPVWDVRATNHRGQIDDGVASHTGLVEPWVLTNQMTGQETTMGAPRNCYLLHVELDTFQNAFNSKLVGRKTLKNYKRTFVVVKTERHMENLGERKEQRKKFYCYYEPPETMATNLN